jgi:hypothetical protein
MLAWRFSTSHQKKNLQTTFNINMPKFTTLVRLAIGFIALVSSSAIAQTYVYTYTGNDFTSIFNAANEGLYSYSGPYTTSDKITGSIAFSAPLGDNYNGSPSATMLSYNFTDGVGPQSAAGDAAGGLGFPYVMDSTFGTDSSGNIVSWNFAVTGFSPSGTITKGIQTENDSGNVVDSGNVDVVSGIVGEGSVSADPGVWVKTVVAVPEPSVGPLFVSFAALVLAFGRFKPSPPRP